jgi:hypothetical protein
MKNIDDRQQNGLKLVPFFRSLAGEFDMHLYAHMFREDVALAIMPIGGNSRRHTEFTTQLVGVDSDKALALLSSLAGGKARGDLNRVVSGAIEKVIKNLVWGGCALYEIFTRDETLNVIYISPRRTFYLPWVTVQFVPRADREQWKRKYSIIRNSSVWRVSIPACLGGRRGYEKMIKSLSAVNPGAMPGFVHVDMNLGVQSQDFNMQEYDLLQKIAINKATELWNWHRRDSSEERQTGYYTVYKRAKFRFTQAILREHVICEVNKLFKLTGLSCELSVSGIPTSNDILLVLNQLQNGQINLGEVHDQISV